MIVGFFISSSLLDSDLVLDILSLYSVFSLRSSLSSIRFFP